MNNGQFELGFYCRPHGEQRHDALRSLADAGIKYIGIDAYQWDEEGQGIKDLKDEMDGYGQELYSMHSLCSILATPHEDTPPELLAQQLKEIKEGAFLGARNIVYHACCMRDIDVHDTAQVLKEISWDEFVERNAKNIINLALEAEKSGISLVFENTFFGTPTESFPGFADIIQAVDKANVGYILDTGHAHIVEKDLAEEISFAGASLLDTHIHDNLGQLPGGAWSDAHWIPGLGTIDWPSVVMALQDIDYPYPIMFEGVLGPGDDLGNGPFRGNLTYPEIIKMTIDNWRAYELLSKHMRNLLNA